MTENRPQATGARARFRALVTGAEAAASSVAATGRAPVPTRRQFLSTVGASAVAASVGGCIRKPQDKILPYSKRPEDTIPGKPNHFATSMAVGGAVYGLLVESHHGRPTKVEGNPTHPMSGGGANAWAQASVLEAYEPDRSRNPVTKNAPAKWEDFDAFFGPLVEGLAKTGGGGLALLMRGEPSPTLWHQFRAVRARFAQARFYRHDEAWPTRALAGAAIVGVPGQRAHLALSNADVIVALDSDFLLTEGDHVRHAREFAARRKLNGRDDKPNRLYAVEPHFTVTGSMADNRLRLAGSQVGEFLAALAAELVAAGVPVSAGTQLPTAKIEAGAQTARAAKWAKAAAADLAKHRGRSAIIVGERQPPHVHALGLLVNEMLGNLGQTVHLTPIGNMTEAATLAELTTAMNAGEVEALIVLGGNPVYEAPADLDFGAALAKVPASIHLGFRGDETASACTWHVPQSHFLESWGDLQATDGTVSLQQPLISPIFESLSVIEFVARLAGKSIERSTGKSAMTGFELLREYWTLRVDVAGPEGFERNWRRWLHEGVIDGTGRPQVAPRLLGRTLGAAWRSGAGHPTGTLEANLYFDQSVFDGRFAGSAWLQESPDSITKLAWDNAACLSPATAERLGLGHGDMAKLTVGDHSVDVAVTIVHGQADDTVALSLGYGRTAAGEIGNGTGFDANAIRTTAAPYIAMGATLAKTGGTYLLTPTQEHPFLEGRSHIRQATVSEFRADPNFAEKAEVMPVEKVVSIFEQSNKTDGQQWGMAIDLNACTGCNACHVACQAENNIPVVGKDEVANGREMHWIRLDRYFVGEGDDVEAWYQPVGCVHCGTAPCENVCPVAATTHGPEGTNDIAYNRCIGTRYCANNCPVKVRRFNFFNYNQRNDDQYGVLHQMVRNPDVTVRFRGVIEKCTYCVQRINAAKIDSKRAGLDLVPDGTIVPACGQTCPTGAITFGNINDENSAVAKQRANPRNYVFLREINIQPRTSYLARVRNPNPELS